MPESACRRQTQAIKGRISIFFSFVSSRQPNGVRPPEYQNLIRKCFPVRLMIVLPKIWSLYRFLKSVRKWPFCFPCVPNQKQIYYWIKQNVNIDFDPDCSERSFYVLHYQWSKNTSSFKTALWARFFPDSSAPSWPALRGSWHRSLHETRRLNRPQPLRRKQNP